MFNYNYIILILNLIILNEIHSWAPDIEPKFTFINQGEKITNFFGNSTDFFKILNQDDTTILIGAKNAVYNLSLNGLRENYSNRIEWSSTDADRELCALKGKNEQDCQNYIRVFARINEQKIMICGTNSYKPRCRYYYTRNDQDNGDNEQQQQEQQKYGGTLMKKSSTTTTATTTYEIISEIEAQGRCPYNPNHNSTYIYTNGQLYSATVADFSGADPLIYRENLRTEQYDLKQLNQPAFVNAVERNGYVFFFFREIAMEYMNCGTSNNGGIGNSNNNRNNNNNNNNNNGNKMILSRVGRVCKNDRGGPYGSNDRWTTFLKARLNCSVPGEYPFYFDEIQSTSQIIDGIYYNLNTINHSSIIYGVFTTSINAIPGSAICAFNINDILNVFEGNFKYQNDGITNLLPLTLLSSNEQIQQQQQQQQQQRPGQCVDDSRTLSSTLAKFVKTHSLMEQSVTPLYDKPLLTRVRLQYRLTAITIDPQVMALDGNTYDIIFVGTDSGRIVKFITIQQNDNNNNDDKSTEDNNNNDNNNYDNIKTIVIAEIQVLPLGMAVRELSISHKTSSLIVIGNGNIVSIPLHHCSQIFKCISCLHVQDPYCYWDIQNKECKSITNLKSTSTTTTSSSSSSSFDKNYLQSLNSTKIAMKLCKKFDSGSSNNDEMNKRNYYHQNDDQIKQQQHHQQQQQPIVYHSTRGTVSGIGVIGGTQKSNGFIGGLSDDHNPDGIGIYPTNIDSANPMDISSNDIDGNGNGESLKLAGNDTYCGYIIYVLPIFVFIVGVAIGWYSSKRLCKNLPFNGAAEHRNQLNPKTRPFSQRSGGGGKDVNLLMNTNAFNQHQCNNNKKDNLEHDFVVGDKDRSHECKNSTENLEKEIHKTGTLTKVKRTYI